MSLRQRCGELATTPFRSASLTRRWHSTSLPRTACLMRHPQYEPDQRALRCLARRFQRTRIQCRPRTVPWHHRRFDRRQVRVSGCGSAPSPSRTPQAIWRGDLHHRPRLARGKPTSLCIAQALLRDRNRCNAVMRDLQCPSRVDSPSAFHSVVFIRSQPDINFGASQPFDLHAKSTTIHQKF